MSTRIVLAKTAGQQPDFSHGCLKSSLYYLLETLIGSNYFEMGLSMKLFVNSERRAFAEHRRDTENPEAVKSNGIVLTALLSIRTYVRTSGRAAPKPSG